MYGTEMLDPKIQPKLNVDFANIKAGQVVWPVDARALQALVDLGLSDQKIASYFRVSVASVIEVKARYASGMQPGSE